jgi:hypothetical protein
MSDWARPKAYRYTGSRKAKAARSKAAKASKQRGGRSYLDRRSPDMGLVDPYGKKITTRSTNPVVVAVDVTGSMSHWPYEIFDRLPLLYQTLSQYRPDVEISFIAVGDAFSDQYPLQVCDFSRGIGLEDQLNALYGEGGGGGTVRESYELFAYYLLNHARAPEAKERPFLILYGDEGFYQKVASAQIRHYLGDGEERDVDSLQVFRALAEAWNVYHLRKPYGRGRDADIEAQWAEAIGREKIVRLDAPERAVDLAMGLIARSWGHYADFSQNMSARQSDAVVRKLGDRLDEVLS